MAWLIPSDVWMWIGQFIMTLQGAVNPKKNPRFDPSPLRLIHGYGREVYTLYYYQEWVVLIILSI